MIVVGLLLVRTRYSTFPMRAVPAGRMIFCAPKAVETSLAEMCLEYIAFGSMSTITCRTLPPQGSGIDAPWTVASRVRMKFSPRSYRSCSVSPLPERLN